MERGKPPYKVCSGFIPDVPESPDQFSKALTFDEAVGIVADISSYGQSLFGQYILDSTNVKVLDMNNPDDVKIVAGFGTSRYK